MVTLAFGQAVSILVLSGSPQLTGGEQGQALRDDAIPAALTGVLNTRNLYWIALGYLAVCAVAVWTVSTSTPGRVMRALRDNERRVEVLGLNPYLFKLLSFVTASLLATAGGIVYLLLLGGATPDRLDLRLRAGAAGDGGPRRLRQTMGCHYRRRGLRVREPIAGPAVRLRYGRRVARIRPEAGGTADVPTRPGVRGNRLVRAGRDQWNTNAAFGTARTRPRDDPTGADTMTTYTAFDEFSVPVEGGDLAVLRWPGTDPAAATVLLVHGITANAMAWAGVVEAVAGRACLIAPDLRGRAGRGRSPDPGGSTATSTTSSPCSTTPAWTA